MNESSDVASAEYHDEIHKERLTMAIKEAIGMIQQMPWVWTSEPDENHHMASHLFEQVDLDAEAMLSVLTVLDSDENKDSVSELIEKIRFILAYRADQIRNFPPLDYFSFPQLPVNQACLLLAHAVTNDSEAVCQVLMPYINSTFSDFLRFISFWSL